MPKRTTKWAAPCEPIERCDSTDSASTVIDSYYLQQVWVLAGEGVSLQSPRMAWACSGHGTPHLLGPSPVSRWRAGPCADQAPLLAMQWC